MPKTKARKRKAPRKMSYQEREDLYDEKLAKLPKHAFIREMQRGEDLLKRILTKP